LENKALSGLATRWAFWQLEGVQVKVLFVSDSLGCPIEQRGIHNFSMGLIENLQSIGAKVDLLVERPPT
jgi:hypothetical protein